MMLSVSILYSVDDMMTNEYESICGMRNSIGDKVFREKLPQSQTQFSLVELYKVTFENTHARTHTHV
jgi:hypothetical protein